MRPPPSFFDFVLPKEFSSCKAFRREVSEYSIAGIEHYSHWLIQAPTWQEGHILKEYLLVLDYPQPRYQPRFDIYKSSQESEDLICLVTVQRSLRRFYKLMMNMTYAGMKYQNEHSSAYQASFRAFLENEFVSDYIKWCSENGIRKPRVHLISSDYSDNTKGEAIAKFEFLFNSRDDRVLFQIAFGCS